MRYQSLVDHRPARNIPTIYGLKDPRHGMFCYVGQAVDVDSRYRQHVDERNADGNMSKALWLEDMRKAGIRPELVVLQECATFQEADAAEQEWIRKMIEDDHPLLNIAKGGAGVRSQSKLMAARKRDWIEFGYVVKFARDTTLQAMCDLSSLLPKASKEVALFERAYKSLNQVKSLLEARLYAEYPKWDDVTKVFYGAQEDHAVHFGEQHAKVEQEVRDARMTSRDVQNLMDQVKGLNDFGIGVFDDGKLPVEERKRKLDEGRRTLLESVDSCNKVCAWLADVDRMPAINTRIGSSYGLRHEAEKDIGYITNGVFITAAIYCGFRYRIVPGSPNVFFGMSSRSLKAMAAKRSSPST